MRDEPGDNMTDTDNLENYVQRMRGSYVKAYA